MTTITLKDGTFTAEIVLESLPSMPLSNSRKLLKLLFSDRVVNDLAIREIKTWTAVQLGQAKKELFESESNRAKSYAYRNADARKLAAAVKSAKTKYAQLMKLQTILNNFS